MIGTGLENEDESNPISTLRNQIQLEDILFYGDSDGKYNEHHFVGLESAFMQLMQNVCTKRTKATNYDQHKMNRPSSFTINFDPESVMTLGLLILKVQKLFPKSQAS